MLIFRYDDFSASESIKIEIDEAIFRAFQAHKIPLIVSVTPKMASNVHDAHDHSYRELGTDQRRLDMLRGGLDLGWELVLHGLTHRRTTFQDSTEFAGCSRREQMMRLEEGREKLLTWFPGSALKTFVPPWNSYDSVTVEAVAANGFDVLCAGPDVKPTVEAGLRIIPSEMTIDDLMTFVQVFSARRLLTDLAGASVVVTFHEYDFLANDEPSQERLDALSSTLSQLVQSEALCGTIGSAGRSSFDTSKTWRSRRIWPWSGDCRVPAEETSCRLCASCPRDRRVTHSSQGSGVAPRRHISWQRRPGACVSGSGLRGGRC